ncbi:hypothetical protein GN244_ATG16917 [Phytophthora infestans]|uniref:Uncharacterized protein n=1 Tax=Phytophthora infestans TaxID=4787 RepID=A0A833SKK4_PHYIN|nr:hypothetical protein GN244_ATG16917 [Phytophthora infestans]KAF4128103.1 hypothetical protein GN958_ATG22649 [Phytophthora infestans]
MTSARIFGDDGSSEWVNVLVPGHGRCYVQRTELELQDTSAVSAGGVTDLKCRLYTRRVDLGWFIEISGGNWLEYRTLVTVKSSFQC